MKALNLFPLTVAQDKIVIDENERKLLVDEIIRMQENTNTNSEYAWTGDTKGYEFLFENKIFKSISNKTGRLQTGFIYDYAFVMLLGLSILLTYLILK